VLLDFEADGDHLAAAAGHTPRDGLPQSLAAAMTTHSRSLTASVPSAKGAQGVLSIVAAAQPADDPS